MRISKSLQSSARSIFAVFLFLGVIDHALANSFTITTASTTAQTLGTASGQTGVITSAGSLTVSGSTVAVTISGNNETLSNDGVLKQTGTGRAIRDNTGVMNLIVNNGSSTNSAALIQTADADVIQMAKSPASVTLNNYGTMTSLNASAGGSQVIDFNAIQSGANIVNNYSTGVMQASEADAVRPGLNGVVYNAGLIKSTTTTGSSSDGVDAQNNSGVQITNDLSGMIEGARHGITGGAIDNTVNFTMSITNNPSGTIKGDNGAGVNIDGFNAKELVTIMNSGSITGNGVTGDGDGVDVDGLVNLNNSGTIRSINSAAAANGLPPSQSEGVTVGGGTIANSGTIEGDVASGNANAVGRGITFAGIDTSGVAEPIYATSSITNSGLIKGQSDSAIAVDGGASGFTVTITNQAGGTIEGGGATAAAIRTGADNDTINNSGAITADNSGKAIDMGAGDNTLNILGGTASVTGDINGGVGGTNTMTVDPGAGNSFSYAGSISNFSSVTAKSGTVTFTGSNTYSGQTNINGGTLVAGAAGALGGTSAVVLNNGATLRLAGSGDRINDSAAFTFAGGKFDTAGLSETTGTLSLTSNSTIDLGNGDSLLHFAKSSSLAGSWSGTLSIYDWTGNANGGGVDQLFFGTDASGLSSSQLGEINFYSGNGSGFLGAGMILGNGEVVPNGVIPEPSSLLLCAAGGGAIFLRSKRRRPANSRGH